MRHDPLSDPSMAFVSTYPPTACGLASFTASLRSAMAERRGNGESLAVVRVLDGDDLPGEQGLEVVATVNPADHASIRQAAGVLSKFDVVILQHEYGIYGPASGRSVLDLVAQTQAPVITTLHTVLTRPTDIQRSILSKLVARSAHTVVLTNAAQRLLVDHYGADPNRLSVIPHGTDLPPVDPVNRSQRPTLLTWGLIGPGKGLEWALQAVGRVKQQHPDVRYIIAGRTHPKVVESSGESYRESLQKLVADLGLADNVEFVDSYLSREQLHGLLQAAHAVVLPYESTEQVVSGVLAEAVAACVPVVSTDFPHARELAELGAVRAVPHHDPGAMATAINGLLDDDGARAHVIAAQRELAPALSWSQVAARYEYLARRLTRVPVALEA